MKMCKKIISAIVCLIMTTISIILLTTNSVNASTERDSTSLSTDTDRVCASPDKNPVSVYKLKDDRTYGMGDAKSAIQYEGIAGFKLHTNGNVVEYEYYTHSKGIHTVLSAELKKVTLNMCQFDYTYVSKLDTSFDDKHSFDVSKLPDGVYVVAATFPTNVEKYPELCVPGYIYVEGGKAKTCKASSCSKELLEKYYANEKESVQKLNIKDCLRTDNLSYPTVTGYHCVKEIMDISDEICKDHDDWSDEMKVYAFVKYIVDNYAYDNYRVYQLHGDSRAKVANNYNNPNLFMLNNHVGVCWDFVNWLAIMCRHHNIPCTSITNNNQTHTWNAVYLDGEWMSIDITDLMQYQVEDIDTSKSNWTLFKSGNWSKAYGGSVDAINNLIHIDIWTYQTK